MNDLQASPATEKSKKAIYPLTVLLAPSLSALPAVFLYRVLANVFITEYATTHNMRAPSKPLLSVQANKTLRQING